MRQNSVILRSESELKKTLESTKNSLAEMSRLTFWKSHFSKHKFHFDKNKFNWETFRQIPFFAKSEFVKSGVRKRLFDTRKFTKKNSFGVALMSTSGTATQKKPILLVKSAHLDRERMDELFKNNNRTLLFFQPRTLSLRILCSFFEQTERQGKNNQALFVNPYGFKTEMIEAIYQMHSASTFSFPSCITYLTSTFPEIKRIFSTQKKLLLGGDFLSQKQANSVTSLYPDLEIIQNYMMIELDLVGKDCKFLRKKYGVNTYHPTDNGIIELIDIDSEGVGEIIVTKLNPLEVGYIRYRTGDLARAIKDSCPCGKEWMFSLVGRNNMDYIKSLGTLISRTEIEKALNNLNDLIEEWRGEVREIEHNGSFIGELKLILKPYVSVKLRKLDIYKLENIISASLRLTPNKTLEMLVREEKFMPLKIEFVDRFPQTTKKVLLRKIID